MSTRLARIALGFTAAAAVAAAPLRPASTDAVGRSAVPASNPAFTYLGRFDFSDRNLPVAIWEASQISVDFDGPILALQFGRPMGQNFFNVVIDGATSVVGIPSGEVTVGSEVWTAPPLRAGRHHLALFKRSEASAGTVAFRGIEVARGATVSRPATPRPAVTFLFFGDSITVGACDEDGATDQWDNRRTHNAALSYAALTSQAFGAAYENISVSGMGIVTGYVDVTFKDVWDRVYPAKDSPKADLSAWDPQVIFINYGANDISFSEKQHQPLPASFVDEYVAMERRIRAQYPEAEIVILRGGMSETEKDPVIIEAWNRVVQKIEAQDAHATHFVFEHYVDTHPRVSDHRLMAAQLVAWLRTQPFMAPFHGPKAP